MASIHSLRSLQRPQSSLTSCLRQLRISAPTSHSKTSARSISFLTPRRPQLHSRSALSCLAPETSDVARTSLPEFGPDVAISSHPAFTSLKVRYSPRNTMQGFTLWVKKRRTGLMARMKTKSGRNMLARKKKKGRWPLHMRMMKTSGKAPREKIDW